MHLLLLPMFETPDLPVCLVDVRYDEGRRMVSVASSKEISQ